MKTPALFDNIDLIAPHAKSLNQISEEVLLDDINSPKIQRLIDRMFEIGQGEQGNPQKPTMVGLAAPQVGVNLRIILVGIDSTGNGQAPQLQVYINPVITYTSPDTIAGREGCYSTSRVCGVVERAETVHIKARDRRGKLIEYVAKGFPARIFQHEIDHLNGIRFPERITDSALLHWVPLEQFGEYRGHWQTWEQLCPPERWEAIKGWHIKPTTTL